MGVASCGVSPERHVVCVGCDDVTKIFLHMNAAPALLFCIQMHMHSSQHTTA